MWDPNPIVDAHLWGANTPWQLLREWSPSNRSFLWELTTGVIVFAGKRPSYWRFYRFIMLSLSYNTERSHVTAHSSTPLARNASTLQRVSPHISAYSSGTETPARAFARPLSRLRVGAWYRCACAARAIGVGNRMVAVTPFLWWVRNGQLGWNLRGSIP